MRLLIVLLVVLLIAVPMASAQQPLEIVSVEQCGDGVSAVLNVSLQENEVLMVGWAYSDERFGVAANGVFLTGLEAGEQEIVIPHLGVKTGEETLLGAVILDTTNMELLPEILSQMAAQGDPSQMEMDEDEMMALLGQIPADGEMLTVSDCSIEGKTPTVSNVDFDVESLLGDLEGLADQ